MLMILGGIFSNVEILADFFLISAVLLGVFFDFKQDFLLFFLFLCDIIILVKLKSVLKFGEWIKDLRGGCMNISLRKSLALIASVIIGCIIMTIIEVIIEPAYFVKSVLKVILFLIVPFVCMRFKNKKVFADSFALNKKNVLKLLGLGVIIYTVIMTAFFLTKGVFDYPSLVQSLSADQNVSQKSFIWVALYISFGNSLLEEFLFRFVAFIKLSEYTTKTTAYMFSSIMFALYHIAMVGGVFPFPLLLLALVGLTVGGLIFNYVDDKNKNIYNSWIIHMFADFAIMTIWYIYI